MTFPSLTTTSAHDIVTEWQSIGVSQAEIAREIEVKQPSVSAIAVGKTTKLRWNTGQRLLDLHHRRCVESQQAGVEK